MNILFIGDIFASAGRRIVAGHFQDIVGTNRIDLAVANAEDIEGSQPGQLSIYGLVVPNAARIRHVAKNPVRAGQSVRDY